jgi:hypothetical protein
LPADGESLLVTRHCVVTRRDSTSPISDPLPLYAEINNLIIREFNRYSIAAENRNLLGKLMISLQTVGKESQTAGPYGGEGKSEYPAAFPPSTNYITLLQVPTRLYGASRNLRSFTASL